MTADSRGGFSVSWAEHSGSICSGLQELQQRSEFVDMTIAADGHLVLVHQLVIGLASPYLKELIRSAPSPHPIIFLNNVSHKVLCCILEYVYTGEVAVPGNDIKNFLNTGKALHIKGLDDMTFQEHLTTKNRKHISPDVVEAATTLENISSGQILKPQSNVLSSQLVSNMSSKAVNISLGSTSLERSTPHALKRLDDFRDKSVSSPKIIKLSEYDNTEVLEEITYDDEDKLTHSKELDDTGEEQEDGSFEVESTLDSIENYKADPNKPGINYTISNMGGIQMILNRFMYRMRNKYKDGRRRWQCVNYNKTKCTAMAITHDNKVLNRESFHNHPFHDKKILAKIKNGLVYSSIKNVPNS